MIKIIEQFVRRMLMGKGSGILKIPPKKDVNKFAKDLLKKFKEHGVSDSAVNNPKDVKIIWEQITNKEAQVLRNNMQDLVKELDTPLPTKKSADVHPFQGFTPKIVPNKRAEFLKKYTKEGQPNDVELNALVNEHRILSAEAKKLGDAGEKYGQFQNLNKRTEEIEEILDFIKKEFPEDMASGGMARVGYENGLKVTDEDFYLGDPGFLRELPDPYKDLPEEERKMRKEMDEIMRKRFYKDPYEGMSEEEIEFIKNQLKIREQQTKERNF